MGADLAQEVVAETFLVAWRRLDDIPGAAIPWLYRVALYEIANLRRRQAKAVRLHDALRQGGAGTALRDEEDEATDLARAVATAFAHLKPRDQEILRLAAWEQLSSSEGAAVLQCSVPAYRMRLHRARIRLAVASGARETYEHTPTTLRRLRRHRRGRSAARTRSCPAWSWCCERSHGSGLFGPDRTRSAPGRRNPGAGDVAGRPSRHRHRGAPHAHSARRHGPEAMAAAPARRVPKWKGVAQRRRTRYGAIGLVASAALRRDHHTAVGFTVGGSSAGSGHQCADAGQPSTFPCTDMTSSTNDLTPTKPSGPRHRAA